MSTKPSRTHEVTIRVTFDAPLTARQARYAVWNAIHDYELFGDGKPRKSDPDWFEPGDEPYDTGRIKVSRNAPRKRRG